MGNHQAEENHSKIFSQGPQNTEISTDLNSIADKFLIDAIKVMFNFVLIRAATENHGKNALWLYLAKQKTAERNGIVKLLPQHFIKRRLWVLGTHQWRFFLFVMKLLICDKCTAAYSNRILIQCASGISFFHYASNNNSKIKSFPNILFHLLIAIILSPLNFLPWL